MKTLTQKIAEIGKSRRKRVDARAAALIAEEMTLQELRQARKLTQVRLAKTLGISKDEVAPKPLRRKHVRSRH
jgi:DNA-binding transcriptional regulator YiaG